MLDFAMAQIHVLFPDIHSQAAATCQQLFCSLQSSIGVYVHTYIFKALIFLLDASKSPNIHSRKEKMCPDLPPSPGRTRVLTRGAGSGPCSTEDYV